MNTAYLRIACLIIFIQILFIANAFANTISIKNIDSVFSTFPLPTGKIELEIPTNTNDKKNIKEKESIIKEKLILYLDASNIDSEGSPASPLALDINWIDLALPVDFTSLNVELPGLNSDSGWSGSSTLEDPLVLMLDGREDLVEVVVNSKKEYEIESGESITLEIWAKPKGLQSGNRYVLFSKEDNYNLTIKSVENGKGLLEFSFGDDDDYYFYETSEPLIENNKWFHIVFAKTFGENENTTIFVNGCLLSGKYVKGKGTEKPFTKEGNLNIGGAADSEDGDPLEGDIAIIRVYEKFLKKDEVLNNYLSEYEKFHEKRHFCK